MDAGRRRLEHFPIRLVATFIRGNFEFYNSISGKYDTISIGAPEASTWLMTLAGFAALGFDRIFDRHREWPQKGGLLLFGVE